MSERIRDTRLCLHEARRRVERTKTVPTLRKCKPLATLDERSADFEMVGEALDGKAS
jgi:hypothetical protein